MNVLLLGIQGSGKGTQATRLAAEYGLAHVATGDGLRAEKASGSELGNRVAAIMERGDLVPDELMIELIRSWLSTGGDGFVLDGFPRTLPQAEALDALLEDVGQPLDVIFDLQVPDDVARARMAKRALEEGRADDTPEAIERRIALYHENARPILDHYFMTGKLVAIHAERAVTEVWAELQQALEQAAGRAA